MGIAAEQMAPRRDVTAVPGAGQVESAGASIQARVSPTPELRSSVPRRAELMSASREQVARSWDTHHSLSCLSQLQP